MGQAQLICATGEIIQKHSTLVKPDSAYLRCLDKRPLPILFHNLRFLEDVFSFFVLLSFFIGFLILPAQNFLALEAIYISHCVQPRSKLPVLLRSHWHIHHICKQVRPAIPSLWTTASVCEVSLLLDYRCTWPWEPLNITFVSSYALSLEGWQAYYKPAWKYRLPPRTYCS